MLLNNKGSATYGFLGAFLVIFLICFIYIYLNFSQHFKNSNTSNSQTNYEQVLKDATKKYVDEYYSDLALDNRIIVKIATLRNYNYIGLNNCKGYSIVENISGTKTIEPYVKCDDYVSPNYQEMYE